MSNEPSLDELREKARTNYGITNADDLDAERLQSEMDTIDEQAKVAAEEQKDITRNPDRAASNSTTNPASGVAAGSDTTGDSDEDEEVSEAKPLSKQTKAELLETASAEEVEVEDTDTVPVLREKIQAARNEREAGDEEDDDDEDDTQE